VARALAAAEQVWGERPLAAQILAWDWMVLIAKLDQFQGWAWMWIWGRGWEFQRWERPLAFPPHRHHKRQGTRRSRLKGCLLFFSFDTPYICFNNKVVTDLFSKVEVKQDNIKCFNFLDFILVFHSYAISYDGNS
jgi:hypothetical protein